MSFPISYIGSPNASTFRCFPPTNPKYPVHLAKGRATKYDKLAEEEAQRVATTEETSVGDKDDNGVEDEGATTTHATLFLSGFFFWFVVVCASLLSKPFSWPVLGLQLTVRLWLLSTRSRSSTSD